MIFLLKEILLKISKLFLMLLRQKEFLSYEKHHYVCDICPLLDILRT